MNQTIPEVNSATLMRHVGQQVRFIGKFVKQGVTYLSSFVHQNQ